MILDIYRGSFDAIHMCSPSIYVDDTIWKLVRDYIDNKMNLLEEQVYCDTYKPYELLNIIETQKKVIDYQKLQKHKKLHQIFIVIMGL
jgi:NAD+--asparagine ADP-ribosyltransferase